MILTKNKTLSNAYKLLIVSILSATILSSCQKQAQIVVPYPSLQDSLELLLGNRKQPVTADSILTILDREKYRLSKASLFFLHYELGKCYRQQSVFADAAKHHQEALSIAEEEKDTVNIIRAANQLGTDYRRVGSMPNAAKLHFKALRIANIYTKKNTKQGMRLLSYSLNGVGNVYKNMGRGKEAFSYFKRSSALDDSLGNYLGMAMNLVTMGSILEYDDKLNEALVYYKKAMYYDSLVHSKTGVAICHNRMGQLLSKKEKWDKALYHYMKARTILEEKKDVWNRLKTENEIAWILLNQKKYDQAYKLLTQANQIAKKGKMYGYLSQTQYLIALLHTKRKEYKMANKAWKLCLDYTDSVKKMKNNRKVIDARVDFEREIGKRRIQNLNRVNEEEKSKRRIILFSGAIILILLLTLLGMAYLLIIAQKKRNLALKESNRVRDKLFSIISHDLKAPAVAQKMAIENLKPEIIALGSDNIKKYCSILHENTENQVTVIENLMNWAQLQTDKIKYTPQAINIVSLINEEIKLYAVAAQQKSIRITTSLPKSCIAFFDKQMIAIVIRNLINNAVKFTREGGTIKISCECREDEAIFMLVDDGIGMSMEQISALYTTKQEIKVEFGTKGEKGTGLGLILCRELLERNRSRLLIESSLDKGTTMRFILKKTEDY